MHIRLLPVFYSKLFPNCTLFMYFNYSHKVTRVEEVKECRVLIFEWQCEIVLKAPSAQHWGEISPLGCFLNGSRVEEHRLRLFVLELLKPDLLQWGCCFFHHLGSTSSITKYLNISVALWTRRGVFDCPHSHFSLGLASRWHSMWHDSTSFFFFCFGV